MNMPQIQIRTVKAMLGLNIQKPTQHIEQPKAELYIEQPPASLHIYKQPARLTIDQSRAWRDMGLIGPLESTSRFAKEGRQALLEGIARQAEEGERLMRIEHGGNPIAEIATGKGMRPYRQLGITFIPSVDSVDVHYEPARVEIEVEKNKPIIQAKVNPPIHEYKQGKVSGHMIQYPSIQIDVKY
ncbi:hypothetical protein NP92_07420 [Anoxybacillus gonensis]|uniref:DUF6470 family protein n=1 Tax=Anoxybacillus gonensis TaxID=198467 RepID=A0AAW7THX3_9BACL|nr:MULTISPECIES: DUF6470 family protein [Anoxybacillus]AKS39505.1 hypothetical protein AFK25_13235 [Anoxybacillus gonensis]KGP60610.1 hypothetical protein NP92_07420 [Anoxybacillus gonensis]MBW9218590.1 hypothetical protein [Anoxybacillus sp. ST70]MDO0877965.1 DUF6470 family protein [Anoxybacillus gonensis]